MSRIQADDLLLPSVLDRLIDLEPDNSREVPLERTQSLRELKASVRRDLENLLNTRVPFPLLPAGSQHLPSSLLNYGVPDFASVVLEARSTLDELRAEIETTIRTFEPRFQSVRVEFDAARMGRSNRFIRFIIDGVLHAEPAPEPVRFSSQLHSISNEYRLQEISV